VVLAQRVQKTSAAMVLGSAFQLSRWCKRHPRDARQAAIKRLYLAPSSLAFGKND
jgi:hypothetical protein